jgi:Spy/CpxP family protein refolding chaperone
MKRWISVGLLLISAFAAEAQTQARPIQTLSEQQIADLRAGRGMGLALAAELNGYPGPAHVLRLADKLNLSAEQRANIQKLFDSMKAEATSLGVKLIEQESDLNREFAKRTVTETSLKASISAVAATQAALRETHLKYHLAAAEVLSPAQIRLYVELRGHDVQHLEHRQEH